MEENITDIFRGTPCRNSINISVDKLQAKNKNK